MATSETGRCFICDKHRREDAVAGGIVHRDDLVYAGHVLPPELDRVYLGHLMVDTIRHAPGLGDLTPDEAGAVGRLTNRLASALKEIEGAEHVYAFVVGDAVAHFHAHVVPRYPGTPPEHYGSGILEWDGARRGDAAEVAALCERIRACLG